MKLRVLALSALLCSMSLRAADQPSGASGHWEGAIQSVQTPQGAQDVPLAVDLARGADGTWTGSVDVGPRLKGLTLTDITSNGPAVHFALKDLPGGATFDGKLSPDGKTMTGDTAQGGRTNSFKLTRTGEAKVAEAPKSTPITDKLAGQWQGALEAGPQTLHLLVDIVKQPDGTGGGTLTSVDQNNSKIPLSDVHQDGQTVGFNIRLIDGHFEGQLNADGTAIKGQWSQGGQNIPLSLTKGANPAPAPTSK